MGANPIWRTTIKLNWWRLSCSRVLNPFEPSSVFAWFFHSLYLQAYSIGTRCGIYCYLQNPQERHRLRPEGGSHTPSEAIWFRQNHKTILKEFLFLFMIWISTLQEVHCCPGLKRGTKISISDRQLLDRQQSFTPTATWLNHASRWHTKSTKWRVTGMAWDEWPEDADCAWFASLAGVEIFELRVARCRLRSSLRHCRPTSWDWIWRIKLLWLCSGSPSFWKLDALCIVTGRKRRRGLGGLQDWWGSWTRLCMVFPSALRCVCVFVFLFKGGLSGKVEGRTFAGCVYPHYSRE